jgi:hypothetical protein
MISRSNFSTVALVPLVVISLGGLVWDALADSNKKQTETQSSDSANAEYRGLSGEELWSMNCQRCHNIRPPTMYSDAQWDVIVHHMRVRSNITGAEQRAILEFLKSAR